MKKPVQFDIDGVLADFTGGYERLHSQLLGGPPIRSEPPRWDDLWNKDVWSVIKRSETFWFDLDALALRLEFDRINKMQQEREVYFVTDRPGIKTKRQSEDWLRCWGISNPTVVTTKKKAEFAQAVGIGYSIEDKAGNAVAISYLARPVISVVIDRPYNQFNHEVIGGSVRRVKTVGEFLDIVENGD